MDIIGAHTDGLVSCQVWQTPDFHRFLTVIPPIQTRDSSDSGSSPGLAGVTLILSPEIWALVAYHNTTLPGFIGLELTFAPDVIGAWLQQLPTELFPPSRPLPPLAPTSPLKERILWDLLTLCAADLSPQTATCQPQVNLAVNQRMHRERLIHQMTTLIRQSLDLGEILNTAVQQICNFLQADRVLIVELSHTLSGTICYEALGSGGPVSLLGAEVSLTQAQDLRDWQRLQAGEIIAMTEIDDSQDGAWSPFPGILGVKSSLIGPIFVQGSLWGLLVAHHCHHPRPWFPQEQEFFNHICNHISIAIFQSQLYQQLQQQKANLEDRVAERTQALEQSVRTAAAAQRVKSDFLATISHELRSPLTCVIGMSATLLRWPLGPLTEKQRHYLETIHDSGTHLLELINRILELSQVEVGQTALRVQAFSLAQFSRQAIQRVRPLASTAQIHLNLDLDIPPDTDTFTADPHRLQQVLHHLLTNAIKFTPAKGQVTLQVIGETDGVLFRVIDTGIGIPSHLQPLLFQLFQQLDRPYHRQFEGMGLGLAFTKQIVNLHQGTISVESQEQQGSTFTVRIPRQAWNGTPLLSPRSPEGRVILIEEEEETATLICELLTAAGYQVIWMTDPVIEQLSHFQPLLVIVSEQLNHFDLNRLYQQLQETPTTQQTKVILMGNSPANVHASSTTVNAPLSEPGPRIPAGYLQYPIDPESLLATIAAVVDLEVNGALLSGPVR